jgi:hypothetical protein
VAQIGCDVTQTGCDVAQKGGRRNSDGIVRQLAVRQARVRIPARHPREVFPAQLRRWRGTSASGDG